MNALEMMGLILVVALVGIGFIVSYINSPNGPRAKRWAAEIRELEVRTRMEADEELITDLQKLARLYARAGKRWEAEQALRRALVIARQQWGQASPLVINILQESVKLMESMRRKSEAKSFRKELDKVRKMQ